MGQTRHSCNSAVGEFKTVYQHSSYSKRLVLSPIPGNSSLPVGHEKRDLTNFPITPFENENNGIAHQFPMQIIKILFSVVEFCKKKTTYMNTNNY